MWHPCNMLAYGWRACMLSAMHNLQPHMRLLPFPILQVMSHSMVSPGFWCQAPKQLVPCIGTKTKYVMFETSDRMCGTDASEFRVRNGVT